MQAKKSNSKKLNETGKFKSEFSCAHKKSKSFYDIKRKIIPILKKNDVIKAGIFGSYARGEQKRNSDLDILVKTKKSMSLLGFSHLRNMLSERLKRKIDLVEYATIKPLIKSQILEEEIRIL